MALLVILLGIAIEKLVTSVENIRTFHWFTTYAQWLRHQLESWSLRQDTVILLIIIALPVIGVAFVYERLDDALVLLGFLFSVLVFVYCIGPRELHDRAHKFMEALERGEQTEAQALAEEILEGKPVPEDESRLIQEIDRALFVATNNSFLGVVFWFVVLGPVGAVIYRLSHVLLQHLGQQNDEENSGFYQSNQLLFSILNWIPAHLTALTYGIAGNFVDAMHHWRLHKSYDQLSPAASDNMLVDTGFGAIQIEPDIKVFDGQTIHDTLGLCRRAIIIWITIIAILTLAGWAS
jgi:membrane protein required for beta-lactamase induction